MPKNEKVNYCGMSIPVVRINQSDFQRIISSLCPADRFCIEEAAQSGVCGLIVYLAQETSFVKPKPKKGGKHGSIRKRTSRVSK